MESGEWRTKNVNKRKRIMGESILRDKSFAFAVSVLGLGDRLMEKREYSLKDQVVRSGTSIGANIREGRNAQGYKDMVSKFSIALKEADETQYWLDLLNVTGKIEKDYYESLSSDLNEIISMLISSIKTLKERYL